MNKERRKSLDIVIELIEEARGKLDDAKQQLENVQSEEQDVYDNMPESLQNGEKGEKVQAALDAMQSAYDTLDNFDVDETISYLQEAQG